MELCCGKYLLLVRKATIVCMHIVCGVGAGKWSRKMDWVIFLEINDFPKVAETFLYREKMEHIPNDLKNVKLYLLLVFMYFYIAY